MTTEVCMSAREQAKIVNLKKCSTVQMLEEQIFF